MNLSFAGCGFLGIYHVGVAVSFKKYAPHLLLEKIGGASAGSLAACCLLCDLPLGMLYLEKIYLSININLFKQRKISITKTLTFNPVRKYIKPAVRCVCGTHPFFWGLVTGSIWKHKKLRRICKQKQNSTHTKACL